MVGERQAKGIVGRRRPEEIQGLLCDSEGRPIAIEVFPGNTADPPTLTQIVAWVRRRFGINRIVFVGDRGVITTARIHEDLHGVELDGILRFDAQFETLWSSESRSARSHGTGPRVFISTQTADQSHRFELHICGIICQRRCCPPPEQV